MKTNLLIEINRIKEVMGLSILTEGSGKSGIYDLLAGSAKYIADVESAAVKTLDDLEKAAVNYVEGSAEKLEFNLLKNSIDEIAIDVGVNTSKPLWEMILDIGKKTGPDALAAQKKLLSVLNKSFDEIAEITKNEIKGNVAIKTAVNQGEISADAMRLVLKELELPSSMIDDVVSTFFKGAKESAETASKLGVKLQSGVELSVDYVSAMEKLLADNIFVSKYKQVIKQSEFITKSWDEMVADLTKQNKAVTKDSVEKWFKDTMAKRLSEITNNKNISAADKSSLRKLFDFLLDPRTGIKNIAEGNFAQKGLGALSLYATIANWVGLIYLGYTALDMNVLSSNEELKDQFLREYKDDAQVKLYMETVKTLKAQKENKTINQDQYIQRVFEAWKQLESLYDGWKNLNYVESGVVGYWWPVLTYKAYKRKEGVSDDYSEAAAAAEAASKIDTGGTGGTGGGSNVKKASDPKLIEDYKAYMKSKGRTDAQISTLTLTDMGNNIVQWKTKSGAVGTATKQQDGTFK